MPVEHYIYDGQNILEETDEFGNTQASYTYEPEEYGELISQHRDGKTSYYHYDALGSTRQLTDETETVTDTYTYNAWGETIEQTGTTTNPFRWIGNVGYYWDEETQDYYVRARYYGSTIGRWSRTDLLDFSDGLNLYLAYFIPNKVDPSGHSICFGMPWDTQFPEPPFPNPWPQQPKPPLPEIPSPEELIKCLPCSSFSTGEWGEDLCNYRGFPGVNPKQKSCPCSSMNNAQAPPTDAEIKAMYDNALAKLKLPPGCKPELVIRDKCAGDFAVTCVNKNPKGPHKICIPRSFSPKVQKKWPASCHLEGLIGHELIHAVQACEGRFTGNNGKNGKKITCEETEREAYAHNCLNDAIKNCIPKGAARNKYVANCINRGVKNSCNASDSGEFDKLCKDLLK